MITPPPPANTEQCLRDIYGACMSMQRDLAVLTKSMEKQADRISQVELQTTKLKYWGALLSFIIGVTIGDRLSPVIISVLLKWITGVPIP